MAVDIKSYPPWVRGLKRGCWLHLRGATPSYPPWVRGLKRRYQYCSEWDNDRTLRGYGD